MKLTKQHDEKPINLKRRKVMQGVGAAVAATAALPTFAFNQNDVSVLGLSGRVISKVGSPVKTLILRNESSETIHIKQFINGGLVFDDEVLDCNGICIDQTVALSSGKERLFQFDTRRSMDGNSSQIDSLYVQPYVNRLSAGTRVVEVEGRSVGGLVTLVGKSSELYG